MKSIIITAITSLMLLSLASCRKCVTCQNECYRCPGSSVLLCSTNYYNKKSWQSAKDAFSASSNCMLVEPTESFKVCDENLDNLTYLYEKHNYYCGP